jgi:hypothetical protein
LSARISVYAQGGDYHDLIKRALWPSRQRHRIGGGGIAHAQRDHAARAGPERLRTLSLVGAGLHPCHRAMMAIAQPLREPRRAHGIIGSRRNPASRKAQPRGLGLDPRAQLIGQKRCGRFNHTRCPAQSR